IPLPSLDCIVDRTSSVHRHRDARADCRTVAHAHHHARVYPRQSVSHVSCLLFRCLCCAHACMFSFTDHNWVVGCSSCCRSCCSCWSRSCCRGQSRRPSWTRALEALVPRLEAVVAHDSCATILLLLHSCAPCRCCCMLLTVCIRLLLRIRLLELLGRRHHGELRLRHMHGREEHGMRLCHLLRCQPPWNIGPRTLPATERLARGSRLRITLVCCVVGAPAHRAAWSRSRQRRGRCCKRVIRSALCRVELIEQRVLGLRRHILQLFDLCFQVVVSVVERLLQLVHAQLFNGRRSEHLAVFCCFFLAHRSDESCYLFVLCAAELADDRSLSCLLRTHACFGVAHCRSCFHCRLPRLCHLHELHHDGQRILRRGRSRCVRLLRLLLCMCMCVCACLCLARRCRYHCRN